MGDELAVCVSPTRRQAPEAQTCFVHSRHSRRSFTELMLVEEIKLRYRLLLTSAGKGRAGFYPGLAGYKVYNNRSHKFHTMSPNGSRPRGHRRTQEGCLRGAGRGSKIPSRCLSEAISYPGCLKVEALNSSAVCHPVISGLFPECSCYRQSLSPAGPRLLPCFLLHLLPGKTSALMAGTGCSPSPGEFWRNWLDLRH